MKLIDAFLQDREVKGLIVIVVEFDAGVDPNALVMRIDHLHIRAYFELNAYGRRSIFSIDLRMTRQ